MRNHNISTEYFRSYSWSNTHIQKLIWLFACITQLFRRGWEIDKSAIQSPLTSSRCLIYLCFLLEMSFAVAAVQQCYNQCATRVTVSRKKQQPINNNCSDIVTRQDIYKDITTHIILIIQKLQQYFLFLKVNENVRVIFNTEKYFRIWMLLYFSSKS